MNQSNQKSLQKPQFLVYPKRKAVTQTEAMLYIRVTFQFVTIDKSLGLKIPFKQWEDATTPLASSPFHQIKLEQSVEEHKQKIMGSFFLLSQNGAEPTLREIMDMAFPDKEKQTFSFFSVFEDQILKKERKLTKAGQRSNIGKYRSCLNHLRAFVKQEFNINQISFNRINEGFIDDFENYLRTTGGNGHNSTMKMLQIFKKIYLIGVNNRWTSRNAFAGKKLTMKDVDIQVLTDSELQKLIEYLPEKAYLNKTKGLFLFTIYSGIGYIDVQYLKRKHIELNPNSGQYLIRKRREKTGIEFMVPLFNPLKALLNQWIPNWENLAAETTLAPKISNQKYNEYLKELIALVGIDKRVTTHIGRHTFATTVALENGVPIESVSKMLGHSKMSQTQKYAKVTALKIERETKGLFELLK